MNNIGKIIKLLSLVALFFIYGCDGNNCPDYTSTPTLDQLEEMVIDNCLVLQGAVEEFAAQNDGEFPTHLMVDSTSTGLALIDLLPDGQRLINPFTGERSEPIERRAANPGEIGFEDHAWGGYCGGYTITGCGWDSIIVALSNLDELEDQVIANCLIVQEAAEEFARQNDGVYASDVDRDITPPGNTIVGMLPGSVRLENPFTRIPTEPINGAAATPGQTGYVPIVQNMVNVGYRITGVGRNSRITIIELSNVDSIEDASVIGNCLMLRFFVRWFAHRNNNIYPSDLTTDTNLDGRTVMYWIERSYLRNPYNPDQINPIDGRASNPGETGYEAVLEGDTVVDFIITGVGAVADSLIVELTSNTTTYK